MAIPLDVAESRFDRDIELELELVPLLEKGIV